MGASEAGDDGQAMTRSFLNRSMAVSTPKSRLKQWGGIRKKLAGRELDGRTHDEMPPCGGAAAMSPEDRRAAIAEVDRQIAAI